MPMVKWNKDLLIGLNHIDKNHRHLVQLLNEAYEEFVLRTNVEGLFIDELYKCIERCFQCEEAEMIRISYPHFMDHKAEHDVFIVEFLELYDHYKHEASTFIIILMFLNDWISRHIRETDSLFGKYAQSRDFGMRTDESTRHDHRSG